MSIVRDVLRVKITYKRRFRLRAIVAQLLLGIAGLVSITFICFQLGFGVGRTSLAYVILVALVSLLGSVSVSIILSIIAAACLNFFSCRHCSISALMLRTILRGSRRS